MATLSISNGEIKENIATVLGISRDYANDWDSVTVGDVDRIIRAGRRKFFAAHAWSFLEQPISVLVAAPYSTGTITVVSGVVTLTVAGTFPTLATDYVLIPDGGNVYEIASRDSDNQVTLTDTSANFDALTTFTMYKTKYPLASNFGGWLDPITIENNVVVQECATFPEWTVRGILNRSNPVSGRPQLFTVSQTVTEETGIPAYYLTVYPLPNKAYVLYSRMRVQPGDSLAIAAATEVFHTVFSELMLEAILSAAEVLYDGTAGIHTQNFESMLPRFVKKDQMMRGTRRLPPGRGGDSIRQDPLYQLRIAPVVIT